ncbi:MAG: HAD family hydrolase [Phycisphaerae bacterium]
MVQAACENTRLIERIAVLKRRQARAVMFDFDGTIGMVRAGWMPLMLDMMMETLGTLGPDPIPLRAEAEEYVARLTGRDTYFQMAAFAEHVDRLGGSARTGREYKEAFMAWMEGARQQRLASLVDGSIAAEALMIPGSKGILLALAAAGIPAYLASGSDHDSIVMECGLLGVRDLFRSIHGSAPGQPTKGELLRQLVDSGIEPDQIMTFGDGRAEIEETAMIGGVAVGVASDEPECVGVDQKKRRWVIEAGAHYVIPNYLEPELMQLVGGLV